MKKPNTIDRILQNFRECKGIIACTCRRTGVTRQYIYKLLKTNENFKNEYDIILEEQIDNVEEKMLDKIERGDSKLIQFYLRTKGKDRGYQETQDVTSNGETLNKITDINININKPKGE